MNVFIFFTVFRRVFVSDLCSYFHEILFYSCFYLFNNKWCRMRIFLIFRTLYSLILHFHFRCSRCRSSQLSAPQYNLQLSCSEPYLIVDFYYFCTLFCFFFQFIHFFHPSLTFSI